MITFPREKVAEKNRTFKAWKTYQAMYLHFTGSYDYFKYYGNAPWGTIMSMEKYFAKYENQTGFSLMNIKIRWIAFHFILLEI